MCTYDLLCSLDRHSAQYTINAAAPSQPSSLRLQDVTMDHVPNTRYRGSTRHRSCENKCTRQLDVLAMAHSGSVREHVLYFFCQKKGFSAKTVPKNLPEAPGKLHMYKSLKTYQNCHSKCPNISWEGDGIFFRDHNFWC